ncbi:MAG: hypothetical protein IPG04_27320 [Polyangiaceae bacterium]|nr:hypothetical protein [Polyangiaceae bacterium]
MRTLLTTSLLSLAILSLGVAGCDSEESTNPIDETPEFDGEPGQEPSAGVEYAEGPYGTEIGSTIPNFRFTGFVNSMEDASSAAFIQMADFYNPTGDGVYPEGSPYGAGNPKPTMLMMIVSAGWCSPCRQEAEFLLPDHYADYGPRGGQFLTNLAEGTDYETAEFTDLVSWTSHFDTPWPSVIDPRLKLGDVMEMMAFPGNMVVDTRTMTVVASIAGVADPGGFFEGSVECGAGGECGLNTVCNPYNWCTDRGSAEFYETIESLLDQE